MERLNVASSPVAVNKPSLTYLPVEKRAILFGGFPRRGRAVAETWALESNCWRRLEIAGPPARGAHGAAYDSRRKRVVIFGGSGADGKPLGDTWEFDGRRWEEKKVAGPAARAVMRLAYDAQRSRVVLFGGMGEEGALSDTWEWDGIAWKKVEDNSPAARGEHALVFDSKRKQMILFGGWRAVDGKVARLGDTWLGTGARWKHAASGHGPSERDHHAMAFHEARGVALLFGGSTGEYAGDTWVWDGKKWFQAPDGSAPSPRGGVPAMTYDSHRKRILMYGGWGNDGPLRDLWEWDGTWTQIHEVTPTCAEKAAN